MENTEECLFNHGDTGKAVVLWQVTLRGYVMLHDAT